MGPVDIATLATLAFVVLTGTAAAWDVTRRRIPNLLVLAGLSAALGLRAVAGWPALGWGLAGAGVALLITFPLFALRGLGGGDVKLFAAVGAFMGPAGFFSALLASAIAGGALALAVAIRRGVLLPVLLSVKDLALNAATLGKAGERATLDSPGAVTVPYGAAIALGSLAVWFLQPGGMPW
jgi:prepilin peptidase CpaA